MVIRHSLLLAVAVVAASSCGGSDDTEATAPASVPTTTPAPATSGAAQAGDASPVIETGAFLVGKTLQPGTYVTAGPVSVGCHWERLRAASSQADDVIAAKDVTGQAIVEVLPTDVVFSSSGCEPWTLLDGARAVDSFGDGDWAVGQQVAPGRWTTDGDPNALGCQWERASGFTHGDREVVADGNPEGPTTVDIEADDVRFTTDGCGTWRRDE